MTAVQTSALVVDGLSAGYGDTQVLWDVSMRIDPGEIVALIGSNGAGKTTTLRTISGLMHPARGTITFNGKDITRMEAAKIVGLSVGHLLPWLCCMPLMAMGGGVQGDQGDKVEKEEGFHAPDFWV